MYRRFLIYMSTKSQSVIDLFVSSMNLSSHSSQLASLPKLVSMICLVLFGRAQTMNFVLVSATCIRKEVLRPSADGCTCLSMQPTSAIPTLCKVI